jgi:anti-anti-sigma factor
MQIVETQEAGRLVAALSGRLDALGAAAAEPQLAALAARGGALLLDLAEVSYISSLGLRALLKAAKAAQAAGGSLALCGMQPMVAEVLAVSGFGGILPMHATRAAALGGA